MMKSLSRCWERCIIHIFRDNMMGISGVKACDASGKTVYSSWETTALPNRSFADLELEQHPRIGWKSSKEGWKRRVRACVRTHVFTCTHTSLHARGKEWMTTGMESHKWRLRRCHRNGIFMSEGEQQRPWEIKNKKQIGWNKLRHLPSHRRVKMMECVTAPGGEEEESCQRRRSAVLLCYCVCVCARAKHSSHKTSRKSSRGSQ